MQVLTPSAGCSHFPPQPEPCQGAQPGSSQSVAQHCLSAAVSAVEHSFASLYQIMPNPLEASKPSSCYYIELVAINTAGKAQGWTTCSRPACPGRVRELGETMEVRLVQDRPWNLGLRSKFTFPEHWMEGLIHRVLCRIVVTSSEGGRKEGKRDNDAVALYLAWITICASV